MIHLSPEIADWLGRAATLLVPSKQRAHTVRLAYSAQQLAAGRSVWSTPDVITLEAWQMRSVEEAAARGDGRLPRLLSPAEEWLLWRRCTEESLGELVLVNGSALAEGLRRASSLAADFEIEPARLRESESAEARLLVATERAVRERCRDLHAAPARGLIEIGGAPLPRQRIGASGFGPITPRLRRWCDRGMIQPLAVSAERTSPRALLAADEHAELEMIADWCREQIEKLAAARLLVVLPGAPGRRERLATLIHQALDPTAWRAGAEHGRWVAIEGGAPLASSPTVRHALQTLRWLAGTAFDMAEFASWLTAPYWIAPTAPLRARMELWLRELRAPELTVIEVMARLARAPDSLQAATRALAARLQRAVAALSGAAGSARQWSERFRDCLTVSGWPGAPARSSGEQQTVLRMHELLDEFGQLSHAAGLMDRAQAVQCLAELAQRTSFAPADEDPVVLISPLPGDPVVQYDGIWAAGLHADALPRAIDPDPFLPLPAQIAAGIPAASARGRLHEAHELLACWRARTSQLVLSAPAQEGDLALLASPLLGPWVVAQDRAGSGWRPLRWRRAALVEEIVDERGSAWPQATPLPAGTRSVELQNLCPFRAYAELRLGSGELEQAEPGVPPDVRGRLLHRALQLLWQELGGQPALLALTASELTSRIDRCVQRATAEALALRSGRARWMSYPERAQGDLFADASVPRAYRREAERACRLIGQLCDIERERAPFTVVATELECTLSLHAAPLKLRIDRVDALEDGTRAILDYKTGQRSVPDWFGDRPSHPQLLAYLAALSPGVAAIATVGLTARRVGFEGVARQVGLLPEVRGVPSSADEPREAWEHHCREWRALIERLANEFLAGEARVDPQPGACAFCHAISICRVAERGGAGSNEEEPLPAGC